MRLFRRSESRQDFRHRWIATASLGDFRYAGYWLLLGLTTVAGNDVHALNDYGITPLSIACQNGDAEAVASLLQEGADPNLAVPGGATPLILSAQTGKLAVLQQLIDHGSRIDAVQHNGQTALMFAAAAGHVGAVDVLIDAGADPNHTLPSGFNAFLFAAREGRTSVVKRLIEHGVDVNQAMDPHRTSGRQPRQGMSALMLAVESAHYETAMALVQMGADPNDQRSGYAPLHALAWVRRPQRGDNPAGDPPPRGSGNLTALRFVTQIVAAGADVNLQLRRGNRQRGKLTHRGATPLLMASQTVDLAYMELLLQLGADAQIPNADGTTALMAAAGIGNDTVGEHPGTPDEVETAVRRLVALGLDVNAVDQNNDTAMHGAAYRCFPETVRLLDQLGADPVIWNRENRYGWTPLRIAQGHRPGSFKPDPPTIAAIELFVR